MSAPSTSHGLRCMSWCIIFSLGCICWNSKHVLHLFICLPLSVFILTQYTYFTWVILVFFWYPCDLCGVDPTLVVLEPLVWLCTCPSWQLHLLPPDHLYKTSTVLSHCETHPLCSANLQLYCFLDVVNDHPALMPAEFVLLKHILGCLSQFVWHPCLYPYPWWNSLSLPHGCVRTTSLQWKFWAQVCI